MPFYLNQSNYSSIRQMYLAEQQYSILYKTIHGNVVKTKGIAFCLNIVLMIIGIFGNIISICIFLQKKSLRTKFNWYLLVVTVAKLIFCLTLFTDYVFTKFNSKAAFLHDLNKISSTIIDFILHTSDSCAALLTVYLSLDRLYAIKSPLKIKYFITNLHAKCLISVSLLSLILIIFFNNIICEYNVSGTVQVVYCTIICPTIINTIPLTIILVFNILLVHETVKYFRKKTVEKDAFNKDSRSAIVIQYYLKKSNTERIISSLNSMREFRSKKFTITQKSHCIVIILSDIWAVLTSLPYYLISSYFILFQTNVFEMETVVIIQFISSVFFNSNHCVNFFIYFCFYDYFRETLKALFLKLSIRENKSLVITI